MNISGAPQQHGDRVHTHKQFRTRPRPALGSACLQHRDQIWMLHSQEHLFIISQWKPYEAAPNMTNAGIALLHLADKKGTRRLKILTRSGVSRSRKALSGQVASQTSTGMWSKRGSDAPSPSLPPHPWTIIVIIIRCGRVGGKNTNHFWGLLSSARDNYFLICLCCVQPGICQKESNQALFGSSLQLQRRSRSEYSGCDLSQVSLPRLEGPKSIIGQKQRHILYCRKAETEEGVSVCVHCSVNHSICSQSPPPCSWRQWHQWDKRTETPRRGQAGETAAVQSSGLATDSFRKTQTPWNEELRIKL